MVITQTGIERGNFGENELNPCDPGFFKGNQSKNLSMGDISGLRICKLRIAGKGNKDNIKNKMSSRTH